MATASILTVVSDLFRTRRRSASPSAHRWRRVSARSGWRTSSARSTSSAPDRPWRARSRGPSRLGNLLRPAGSGKTTLARIIAGATGAAFEELRRSPHRSRTSGRCSPRPRSGWAPRAADDPLPRRDPPLQQGPAGRPPAGRRVRARNADRSDDGEPLLRGQLGAPLAHAGLRAPAARATTRSPRLVRRGAVEPRRLAAGRLVGLIAARRAETRARPQHPRARVVDGPIRGRELEASATSRTRPASGRSSTTRPGTPTTTSPRRSSSRSGAPTPTRRSTTSRRCSKAARTALHRAAPDRPRLGGRRHGRFAALLVATAAAERSSTWGFEAHLNLAHATIYLARAPKSTRSSGAGRGAAVVAEHGTVGRRSRSATRTTVARRSSGTARLRDADHDLGSRLRRVLTSGRVSGLGRTRRSVRVKSPARSCPYWAAQRDRAGSA